MKNFLLLKCGLSSGSLAVFEERGEAISFFGLAVAPSEARGEKCSSYFKNSAHPRKCQTSRLAASRLGGQIERDFPAERQFLILFAG